MSKYLILLLLFPFSVFASGLSVSPSSLVFDGGDKNQKQVLKIKNTTDSLSSFQVYLDKEEEFFEISLTNFVLNKEESKGVEIKYTGKSSELLQTNVSIVSTELGQKGLALSGGVKIPLLVHGESSTNENLLSLVLFSTPSTVAMFYVFVGIVLALTFSWVLNKYKIRQNQKNSLK